MGSSVEGKGVANYHESAVLIVGPMFHFKWSERQSATKADKCQRVPSPTW